jgi:erythronate-4-phosphate dehydrogenase
MIIVADRAIPFLHHYFAPLGEIRALDGRAIAPADVRDADVLLVRTVTRVDEALLTGSRVRFVGSPTSGTDHLDSAWLDRVGIAWAAAPGCNARSVAEYVLSALLVCTEMAGRELAGLRAGIIGCGHTGSAVAALLGGAGVTCVLCDPPLAETTGSTRYRPLAEALAADVVTLHVPLTRAGPHATANMVDDEFLAALGAEAILVNAARGEVVDDAALVRALRARPALRAVIDVWRNEPDIDAALLAEVDIATPHIAGYSTDGRLRATARIAAVLRGLAGIEGEVAAPALPEAGVPMLRLDPDIDVVGAVQLAVLSSYDVRSDAIVLRRLAQAAPAELRKGFTAARNDYPLRREFPAHAVIVPAAAPAAGEALRALGFDVRVEG